MASRNLRSFNQLPIDCQLLIASRIVNFTDLTQLVNRLINVNPIISLNMRNNCELITDKNIFHYVKTPLISRVKMSKAFAPVVN